MIACLTKRALSTFCLILTAFGCGSRGAELTSSAPQSLGNGAYALGLSEIASGLRTFVLCDSSALQRKGAGACIPAFTDSQGKVIKFTPQQLKSTASSSKLLNLKGCAKLAFDATCVFATELSLLIVSPALSFWLLAPSSAGGATLAGLVAWIGGAKAMVGNIEKLDLDALWGAADRRNAALIRDALRESATGGTPVRVENLKLSMERLAALMGWKLASNLPANLR